MTKSDLENGMVVEFRNEEQRLVLNEVFIEMYYHNYISDYEDNLKHKFNYYKDIMKVYKANALSLKGIFHNMTLIWERKEKSEAEIKLDDIMNQIKELQKSADELKIVIDKDKR